MKKVTAVSAIISGVALIIWWWSFLLLPTFQKLFMEFDLFTTIVESGFAEKYATTVAHPYWVYINIFEVVSILAGLIFTLFYIRLYVKGESGKEIVMMLLLMGGYFIFCGIAFYETFLWSSLAKNFPEALSLTVGSQMLRRTKNSNCYLQKNYRYELETRLPHRKI